MNFMEKAVQTNRISSIDQFRGLAILAMVVGHYIIGVKLIPDWLKRSFDIGLTPSDLGAPLFIFAIGLTFGLSFSRRVESCGLSQTYGQFFKRYLLIFGAGALISAIEYCFVNDPDWINWGILQMIGVAGLLTLAVIRLPTLYRALVGLASLGVYQLLLDRFWLDGVLRWSMGGFYGSLSWAVMLILATVFADLYHDPGRGRKFFFPLVVFLALAAGIALASFVPVSEHRVTASYVLISLSTSGLVFGLVDLLARYMKMNFHALLACGQNAFALYIIHYGMIGLLFLPGIPTLYVDAPFWLVVTEVSVLVTGVIAIAYWLERKKLILTF